MDKGNLSSVNNATSPPLQNQNVVKLLSQILVWIFFVFIVFLNASLITVFCKRKRRLSRMHFFIFNLALADLGVGLITCFGDAVERTVPWYAGDVFCRIYRCVGMVVQLSANNLVVAMSIDRFLAVRFPMIFRTSYQGKKLDKAMVLVSWLLAMGLSVVFFVYAGDENRNCDIRMPEKYIKPYFLTSFFLVLVIPFLLILACYAGMTYIIWKKYRSHIHVDASKSLTDSTVKKAQPMVKERSSSVSGGVLPKAKIRSIKMTLAICLAFLLCWAPYFIINLLMMYEVIQDSTGYLYIITQVLYAFNSIANPVIFILFNLKMFRNIIFIQKVKGYEERTEYRTSIRSTINRKTLKTSSST